MNQIHAEAVDVEVEGKRLVGYLAKPAESSAPGPKVMVLHAWWGLTDFFKQLCDRLAAEGFTAFAPDLNLGRTAQTVEEAQKLMDERDFEQTKARAEAAVAWMQAQPGRGDGLGLVGFSMGSAWALALAGEFPEAVRAVVLFYGVSGGDFAAMRAHIQGHFAVKDTWDKIEWTYEMEKDMQAAGLQTEFFRYPEAGHWFFESNHPEAFCAGEAALAWERVLPFLKAELAGV